jgi:hypothetical protein
MKLISAPLGYAFESTRAGVNGAPCSALMPSEYISCSFTRFVPRFSFPIKLAVVCLHFDTQNADKEDQVTEPVVTSTFPP